MILLIIDIIESKFKYSKFKLLLFCVLPFIVRGVLIGCRRLKVITLNSVKMFY